MILFALAWPAVAAAARTTPYRPAREYLAAPDRLAPELMATLRARFARVRMEDVLFAGNLARAPRLTEERLLRSLRVIRDLVPEDADLEQPHLPVAFTITPDGEVAYFAEIFGEGWRRARTRLLEFARHAPDHATENLVRLFGSGRGTAHLDDIATSLVVDELGPAGVRRVALDDGYLSFRLVDQAVTRARDRVRGQHLPGRVLDSLAHPLGERAWPNLFRRGLTVYGAAPFEAAFRGIGVGECVRNVFVRYGPVFEPHYGSLTILKDGVDVGYGGVIRTHVAGDETRAAWFIESLQSPHFSGPEPRAKAEVDALVTELQRLALAHDALLTVPPSFHYFTNFERTVALIEAAATARAAHPIPLFDPQNGEYEHALDRVEARRALFTPVELSSSLAKTRPRGAWLAPYPGLTDAEAARVTELARGLIPFDRSITAALTEALARLGPAHRRDVIDAGAGVGFDASRARVRLARALTVVDARAGADFARVALSKPARALRFGAAWSELRRLGRSRDQRARAAYDVLALVETRRQFEELVFNVDLPPESYAPFAAVAFEQFGQAWPIRLDPVKTLRELLGKTAGDKYQVRLASLLLREVDSPGEFLDFVRVTFETPRLGGNALVRKHLALETYRPFLARCRGWLERAHFLGALSGILGDSEVPLITLAREAASIDQLENAWARRGAIDGTVLSTVRDQVFRRATDLALKSPADLGAVLAFQKTLLPRYVPVPALLTEMVERVTTAHPDVLPQILDAFPWRWRFASGRQKIDLFVHEVVRVTRERPEAFGDVVRALRRRLWMSPGRVAKLVAALRADDPRLRDQPVGRLYDSRFGRWWGGEGVAAPAAVACEGSLVTP